MHSGRLKIPSKYRCNEHAVFGVKEQSGGRRTRPTRLRYVERPNIDRVSPSTATAYPSEIANR